MINSILDILLVLPLVACFFICFFDESVYQELRYFALAMSSIIFIVSIGLWYFFDISGVDMQYIRIYNIANGLDIPFIIGVDGLSLFFIILTTFLIPICVLASWEVVKYNIKHLYFYLFLVEFCVLNVFVVLDLVYFFIFFEFLVIPMFLLITGWGSRTRRVHAAMYFFFYTVIGSLTMYLAILYLYVKYNNTSIIGFLTHSYTDLEQYIIWHGFVITFMVKMPIIPIHIWLPEAHVESPTAGSVLLAGILLKMGPYGYLRFILPMFPGGYVYGEDFLELLGGYSLLVGSYETMRQIDFKKLIAYSSVSHMASVFIGTLQVSGIGLVGSVYLMLCHGITSSGLFLCAGILYDRYHTRLFAYYSGVQNQMPKLSFMYFSFCLANMGLPGFGNFIGEVLIAVSTVDSHESVFLTLMGSVFVGSLYNIWVYTRLFHGVPSIESLNYKDLCLREFIYLSILVFILIIMGLYPEIFLDILLEVFIE